MISCRGSRCCWGIWLKRQTQDLSFQTSWFGFRCAGGSKIQNKSNPTSHKSQKILPTLHTTPKRGEEKKRKEKKRKETKRNEKKREEKSKVLTPSTKKIAHINWAKKSMTTHPRPPDHSIRQVERCLETFFQPINFSFKMSWISFLPSFLHHSIIVIILIQFQSNSLSWNLSHKKESQKKKK